ncbi:uncharacterized protein MYCFIDRAFT_83433 [Pseudocercospora fijiensis CIRAD86]|uniref:Uncharacterized protein n=1 Tax=Pseudocercospora fijiensis (strain CIRAD86) TaxID=383855 RepID=M3B7R8_PSEFD|nr:uncharacterized protein MYCFIDRAFT_83433 [Pseudocercospora fijiensis CIRAD86]EME85357.1 hypothetical protein MYCFIDRAFT_83433 [Pseudocercospora fijiensis CIRAD86]
MAEPGIGTLIIALIDGKFDAMDRQISSLREELDEKMSDVTLKLKKLGDDANAHSEKLNELDAKQVELSKSIALLQKPLNSLAKVEEMVRDLGEEYNNVQEEVSRQKELQVTMLEQHNDLRLTVHRQQGFIDTVLGAAANYPGGGAKSVSVRPVSASSPTLNGNTSPNRFPDESTEEENRKRTAFARNSASFDAEAIDSNAMRADSVPASLKRRKAKQDLKAGHERHSSESGILYEQHRSSDEIVLVAAQVHRRASRELPLQSPGTRKILEALENGRDSAEVLRAERGACH